MSGIMWAILGTIIGIGLPLAVLRLRRGAPAAPAGIAPRAARGAAPVSRPAGKPAGGIRKSIARRFHGISIRTGPKPCAAAKALVGQRFLSDEVPTLPLTGCEQAKCQCGYGHHDDRREPDERRSGWGGFDGFAPSIEGGNRRQKKRDRRTTS